MKTELIINGNVDIPVTKIDRENAIAACKILVMLNDKRTAVETCFKCFLLVN